MVADEAASCDRRVLLQDDTSTGLVQGRLDPRRQRAEHCKCDRAYHQEHETG